MAQPTIADLRKARTTIPGAKEVIWAPLYDSFTYPAAGTNLQVMFQSQVGVGGKTEEDTNMRVQGQLPAGFHFLMKGIAIEPYPGLLPGRNANDNSAPAGSANFWNDIYTISRYGSLIFTVSGKQLITDAPLGKFPATTKLAGATGMSDSTTAAPLRLSMVDYAQMAGQPYYVQDITIFNGYSFDVTLKYPNGLRPLPSGQPMKVFVRLLGYLYRNA